jgi:hypothetical protein
MRRSAVYSLGVIGAAGGTGSGGGAAATTVTLETRSYAHRSMPHVLGVDFTFNNSAGTAPLVSNIAQPRSWGSSAASLSTKDTLFSHVHDSEGGGDTPAISCWAGSVEMSEDASLPLIHLGLCTTDLRTVRAVAVVTPRTPTCTQCMCVRSIDWHSPGQIMFAART